jgi:hypothetical protein
MARTKPGAGWEAYVVERTFCRRGRPRWEPMIIALTGRPTIRAIRRRVAARVSGSNRRNSLLQQRKADRSNSLPTTIAR